jgi:putative ABC transport system substrate-binding protein
MKTGNSKRVKAFGFALCTFVFALCTPANAQQPVKMPRIGYVRFVGVPSVPAPNVEAFRRGLRDLGYTEGENIAIVFRYAKGNHERIPSLLAELLQRRVDLLISGDDSVIHAAKQATKTIPIVMVINRDPVAGGLVDSLARPGGNITGISRLTRELNGKRLELLAETVPGSARVAVLWDPTSEGSNISFKEYQAAALALKIQLQSMEVRKPNPDLVGAFQAAVKARASAVIVIGGGLLSPHRKQIVNLAINHRLPSMFDSSLWIEPGGLIAYSSNDAESYRRAAVYVDKILKGAKPADLPVEQPTDFDLAINLKTAKQIGLTIPPNVLARADRVIR